MHEKWEKCLTSAPLQPRDVKKYWDSSEFQKLSSQSKKSRIVMLTMWVYLCTPVGPSQ